MSSDESRARASRRLSTCAALITLGATVVIPTLIFAYAGAAWKALAVPLGFLGGAAALQASRPAYGRYQYARLGPGGVGRCFAHMFSRAFGASDFTRFWRHWNPFWGYFLAYYCFAPLRRFAPRPLCLIVTFALNGLFHDLVYVWPFGWARTERLPFQFPVFTLCLVLIAGIILAAERYRFTLAQLSLRRRVGCQLLAFVGPFALSIGILLLTRI
ncbi:MAG TPA: hypothetical protein PLC99_15115 [Verrucomicrobiota bacterium]|nr:hypothetical protein [Verrucomicrobiota bacterium]